MAALMSQSEIWLSVKEEAQIGAYFGTAAAVGTQKKQARFLGGLSGYSSKPKTLRPL